MIPEVSNPEAKLPLENTPVVARIVVPETVPAEVMFPLAFTLPVTVRLVAIIPV